MTALSVADQPVLDWLLEENNPSARYFTLKELCDYPEDDPHVSQTKLTIMQQGAVPKLLSHQNSEGYWGKPEEFYDPSKYKGTVWSFILLAELGADGRDERIIRAKDFLLKISQDASSGGFAYRGSLTQGGDHHSIIPCLSGNMVWSMLRLGYIDDPGVQRGIDFLSTYLRCDDKQSRAPQIWPYTVKKECWGKHTCMMNVVKTLKALAEIPQEKRSPVVQQAIDNGKEFILIHHLFKRSHNLSKIAKPSWVEFGFPNFYATDALEMLLILKQLDCGDERLQDAIDLIRSKQDSQGKWNMDRSFNGRMLVTIEQKKAPSKWVTLNALRVLKWEKQMNIAIP
ncbi:MAG: hypothetical protein JW908_12085 [Anaerolineales bacterium]|nr:hypothetical protein [Anaerolineales bacterium]